MHISYHPDVEAQYHELRRLYGEFHVGNIDQWVQTYGHRCCGPEKAAIQYADLNVRVNPDADAGTRFCVNIGAPSWYETLCSDIATAYPSADSDGTGLGLVELLCDGIPVDQIPRDALTNARPLQVLVNGENLDFGHSRPVAAPMRYSAARAHWREAWYHDLGEALMARVAQDVTDLPSWVAVKHYSRCVCRGGKCTMYAGPGYHKTKQADPESDSPGVWSGRVCDQKTGKCTHPYARKPHSHPDPKTYDPQHADPEYHGPTATSAIEHCLATFPAYGSDRVKPGSFDAFLSIMSPSYVAAHADLTAGQIVQTLERAVRRGIGASRQDVKRYKAAREKSRAWLDSRRVLRAKIGAVNAGTHDDDDDDLSDDDMGLGVAVADETLQRSETDTVPADVSRREWERTIEQEHDGIGHAIRHNVGKFLADAKPAIFLTLESGFAESPEFLARLADQMTDDAAAAEFENPIQHQEWADALSVTPMPPLESISAEHWGAMPPLERIGADLCNPMPPVERTRANSMPPLNPIGADSSKPMPPLERIGTDSSKPMPPLVPASAPPANVASATALKPRSNKGAPGIGNANLGDSLPPLPGLEPIDRGVDTDDDDDDTGDDSPEPAGAHAHVDPQLPPLEDYVAGPATPSVTNAAARSVSTTAGGIDQKRRDKGLAEALHVANLSKANFMDKIESYTPSYEVYLAGHATDSASAGQETVVFLMPATIYTRRDQRLNAHDRTPYEKMTARVMNVNGDGTICTAQRLHSQDSSIQVNTSKRQFRLAADSAKIGIEDILSCSKLHPNVVFVLHRSKCLK